MFRQKILSTCEISFICENSSSGTYILSFGVEDNALVFRDTTSLASRAACESAGFCNA